MREIEVVGQQIALGIRRTILGEIAVPRSLLGMLTDGRPHSKANRAGTRGFRAPEVLLKCNSQSGGSLSCALLLILTDAVSQLLISGPLAPSYSSFLLENSHCFIVQAIRKPWSKSRSFSERRQWKERVSYIVGSGIFLYELSLIIIRSCHHY